MCHQTLFDPPFILKWLYQVRTIPVVSNFPVCTLILPFVMQTFVLNTAYYFVITFHQNKCLLLQLQTGHRVVLLQCMERIIRETINDLDAPLAVDVIKQCAMELTNSKVPLHVLTKTQFNQTGSYMVIKHVVDKTKIFQTNFKIKIQKKLEMESSNRLRQFMGL